MIYGVRFRDMNGLVVLQVQEQADRDYDRWNANNNFVWRDATVEDLLEVAMFCKPYASVFETRLESLEHRTSLMENRFQDEIR